MTAPPTLPGYPTAPLGPPGDAGIFRRLAGVVNSILGGKLNAVRQVTLAENAVSTTVGDVRIAAASALVLVPLTAHAAALLYETPYVLPTLQQDGSVVFVHASVADADLTFNLLIIG